MCSRPRTHTHRDITTITCINAISEYPCPSADGSSHQPFAEGLLDFRGQGEVFWASLDSQQQLGSLHLPLPQHQLEQRLRLWIHSHTYKLDRKHMGLLGTQRLFSGAASLAVLFLLFEEDTVWHHSKPNLVYTTIKSQMPVLFTPGRGFIFGVIPCRKQEWSCKNVVC